MSQNLTTMLEKSRHVADSAHLISLIQWYYFSSVMKLPIGDGVR